MLLATAAGYSTAATLRTRRPPIPALDASRAAPRLGRVDEAMRDAVSSAPRRTASRDHTRSGQRPAFQQRFAAATQAMEVSFTNAASAAGSAPSAGFPFRHRMFASPNP